MQGRKADKLFKGYESKVDEQLRINRKGFVASMTSVTNQNERRKSHYSLPLLSTIPRVYFKETFHLENPRIFDVVSERSTVVP
jgi:hypothetical protein